MNKMFLRIDDAIIISNAKRIQEGVEKIKDKKHLAGIICEKLQSNKDNTYMKLYRAENQGFVSENQELIDALISELGVDRSILVSSI